MVHIEEFIPFGKENAITREHLAEVAGLSDREMRRLIAKARREHPILNHQSGDGYYRPTIKEYMEAKAFYKQETHRAKMIFWSIFGLRKWLKEVDADG